VTFIPLHDADGLTGILGFIRPVGTPTAAKGHGGLTADMIALRQSAVQRFSFDLLASDVPAMQRVEAQALLAAGLQSPVWLIGEGGTGKETLARIVHYNGPLRDQPFLGLDCSGVQPFLLKNMLFGAAGVLASRPGAIYFKDAEALPRDLQAEVLNWVEESDDPPRIMIGVREVAGASAPFSNLLPEFSAAFDVFEIRLTPLRERLADLPRLSADFLGRDAGASGTAPEIASEAIEVLARHSWPGNLRELAAALRDARGDAAGKRIEAGHLPLYLRAAHNPPPEKEMPKLDDVLERIEAQLIRLALRRAKGNRSEAADALGVQRARLLRRIESLGIDDKS
jgi:DNA-binding NtrC family response regulator